MAEMRLQKFLSQAGIASRRKAEEHMLGGRVMVNGKTCRELGTKVDPAVDKIEVDGARVKLPSRASYLVMCKPKGTICTERDPEGRPTVYKLLPKDLPRMFTVGRLDWDTEGLLLFTTDGELAHALTDPSTAVPRVYQVKIQGKADPHLLRRFNEGVKLDDGRRTKPSPTELMSETETNAWYEVILTEGMNRQIHRMAMACGRRVLKIRRVQYGPIELGPLRDGAVRPLNDWEIGALVVAGGLKQQRKDEHFKEQIKRPRKKPGKPRAKSKPPKTS